MTLLQGGLNALSITGVGRGDRGVASPCGWARVPERYSRKWGVETYAEVAANTKRLEKQKQQADQLVEEWLKRAKLALEKGDEDAARAALERKNQQEETSNSLRAQLETQMQQLEQKISEAKAKKDQLKARAQTAKVSTKINDMMSRSSSTGALEAFNRMQDKVMVSWSMFLDVIFMLGGEDGSRGRGCERAFRRFKHGASLQGLGIYLEGQNRHVEDDLAALKGAISGSSAPKSLSSSSIELDAELQKRTERFCIDKQVTLGRFEAVRAIVGEEANTYTARVYSVRNLKKSGNVVPGLAGRSNQSLSSVCELSTDFTVQSLSLSESDHSEARSDTTELNLTRPVAQPVSRYCGQSQTWCHSELPGSGRAPPGARAQCGQRRRPPGAGP
eukprot:765747-Hanusia_phi.AAC.2